MNSVDDEDLTGKFTYITKNCYTVDVNIDRKITSMQVHYIIYNAILNFLKPTLIFIHFQNRCVTAKMAAVKQTHYVLAQTCLCNHGMMLAVN